MSSQKPSLVLALVVSLALAVGIGLGLVIDSAPKADANPFVAGAAALALAGLSDPDEAEANWMPFDCWDAESFSAIKRGVVEKCDSDKAFSILLSGGELVLCCWGRLD